MKIGEGTHIIIHCLPKKDPFFERFIKRFCEMPVAEIFYYKKRQLSILFYCPGVEKITYGCFFYTISLTALQKQKYWVFDSALGQKTPRYSQ
jgi:hypothetical protein